MKRNKQSVLRTVILIAICQMAIITVTQAEDIIIQSPNITNHGKWGLFENCTEGALVTAFQLKVEPKNSLVDDTGLNGIRFFCGRAPAAETTENGTYTPEWANLTSRIGYFGNWGRIFNCTTYAIGFNLEVQTPQGKYKDDVGATNLKLICAGGQETEGFVNNGHGHLFPDTKYTGAQYCPSGSGICGLQTQVESYQAFGDDTALNNLRVKCCPLLNAITG